MLAAIKRLWSHGIGTVPKQELRMVVGRGKPSLDESRCNGCADCVTECPTGALALERRASGGVLSLAYGACISCRVCTEVCPTGAMSITKDPLPIATGPHQLVAEFVIQEEQWKLEGKIQREHHRGAALVTD